MTILQRRVASAGINDVDGGSTVEGGEEGGPVRNGKGNFSLLLLLRPFRNKKVRCEGAITRTPPPLENELLLTDVPLRCWLG